MPAAVNSNALVSSPVTNSNTKPSLFHRISNTPRSRANVIPSPNKFDLPCITNKLSIKLFQYIENDKSNNKHFKQVSDALKTCDIEITLNAIQVKPTHWLENLGTIDDLANILEALLATVTGSRSSLKTTISDFLKETKLGKVKESNDKKSPFVLRLSDEAKEQRVKDQAAKESRATKEAVQNLSSMRNTPSAIDGDHAFVVSHSQATPLNTESTTHQKARPSISSVESTPPAYPSLPFNSAKLDPVADSPALSRFNSATAPEINEQKASDQSTSHTVATPSLDAASNVETSRLANQRSSSTSDTSDISLSSLSDESDVAQSALISPFKPEKPVYLETSADAKNIYSEKTQVVGKKNGQQVLIDFSRLKWRQENIRNLVHLQQLMNEASKDKTSREKVKSYLHKTGLDAIISYQENPNHLLGNKKYRAKFAFDFNIQTMKLASPSLPIREEEPGLETARQNVLDKLTEYFGEKGGMGKSHHDKLKKTLADSAPHELLMVTPHGAIEWVDEATWPKDARAFNELLRAFSEHHGSNGPLDLKTKSSLLRGLQEIIITVPKTEVSRKNEKKRESDAQKIINKNLDTKNETDVLLQKKLIAYARGERVAEIDKLVHEFVERSFKQSKIEEKTQTLLGKAKEQKLDTQTNQSFFEKFFELFRHPVNTIKGQTDAMHRDNYATHFINLDSAYQKAFEQNIDMVYALYSSFDKKAIDKINDILVVADPDSAFGSGTEALKEKVRAECAKQIDKKMATLVGRIDAAFSAKITQAINHFNTAQTSQSGAALREWFTTFSRQIDAYKAFCADRLAYISNTDKWAALASDNESLDQSDSFNREDTIASIAAHHQQCVEHMEKTLANALLSAIKTMDFSGRLRNEILECNDPKISRVDKAERLTKALSNYKEGVEEAIHLMQNHPGLEEFKKTQRDAFAAAYKAATKRYPQTLTRWGRIKQVLFGEAKKLKVWEHITKGFSKTRKTLLGLGFLTGGAALGVGIASAAGAGIFTLIFAPIMIPLITAALIAGGSIALLGITGYALNRLKSVYSNDVRNHEERIKENRKTLDDHINTVSELFSLSTVEPATMLEKSELTTVNTNMALLPTQAAFV